MQVLDASYLKKYYKTPGSQGYSMQDLQLENMADLETVPFESRSIDMRVMTGQTSLFYTVCCLSIPAPVQHSQWSACRRHLLCMPLMALLIR